MATLAATPVAAANNIAVLGVYGDCQFLGSGAGANKTIKIEWRDAQNNLKSKHSVTSNASGGFTTRCEVSEVIETGDTLRTQIGTSSANIRTVTIPKLTARVDRDADTVEGKVTLTGLDQLIIEVDTYDGGFSAAAASPHFSTPTPSGGPGVGTYLADLWDSAPNIKGWDDVFAIWANAHGDTFVRSVTAEGVQVWARQSFVSLAGYPGQSVAVDLLTSAVGSTLSGLDGQLNTFGFLNTGWTDEDGDNVRAQPGNYVFGYFASDADFTIPNIAATFNKTTDRVTVDCNVTESGSTGVRVDVYSRDAVKFGTRMGFQNNASGGTFLANFGVAPKVNIVAGDKVDVYCKLASGDVVARTFTVS